MASSNDHHKPHVRRPTAARGRRVRFPRRTAAVAGPRIEELADDAPASPAAAPSITATFATPASASAAAAAAAAVTAAAPPYPWHPSSRFAPPPAMPPTPPEVFSRLPELRDTHATATSDEQDRTCSSVLPLVSSRLNPLPPLNRAAHIDFLESGLDGPLPSYMVMLDASRPWIVYWCLNGLALLGVDVAQYRDRYSLPRLPSSPLLFFCLLMEGRVCACASTA